MKNISATRARRRWSNLLGQVQYHGQRFAIIRSGQAAAAIIPFADVERLQDDADAADVALAREVVLEQGAGPRMTWGALKTYLDLD